MIPQEDTEVETLIAVAGGRLLDTCFDNFKAKKDVEILLASTHGRPGNQYRIRDEFGRYAVIRVNKFSRAFKESNAYWCGVLKTGWLS